MRGTLCHSLPVLLGLLLCHPTTASGPCWENSNCQDLASEAGVLYVMSHFRWNKFGRRNSSSSGGHKREEVVGITLPVTSPHRPGGEEEDGEGLQREEGKRSYSMEHFRWGKPVGRKRRPIKVYPNSVDEESAESYPMEFRREMAPDGDPLGLSEEEEEGEGEEEKKDGGSYRMRHFRWHAPLKDKRYGGFMSLEHSQTPLMTLFKNAIVKNAYKKGQ
ncbi:hypothetical protein ASZ78_001446 [Callipepla squamata]|uniref:Uncharacterized protein n=1 Tax=Callipepla squamata TaxID=9009 RepID=A0A226MZ96_CALSU|nr:hypothetical protein ASZ78_001446 [Callipepla squamata]